MQLLCSFVNSVDSRTILVPLVLQAQVSIPGVHREMISRGLPEVPVQRSVKPNMFLCKREGVLRKFDRQTKDTEGTRLWEVGKNR